MLTLRAAFADHGSSAVLRWRSQGGLTKPTMPSYLLYAGCLNGGGQLRPAKGETPQQLIERLEMAYHSDEGGLVVQQPQDSPQAQQASSQVQPCIQMSV